MNRIATIDAAVERAVQKRGRRFLWLWLAASTTASFVGNLAHAWLETARAAAGVPFPLAVAWALIPPLLLMLSVHAVPTLSEMLEDDAADRLLTRVVWGVVIGAFGWSAVGIFAFTVATGVPPALAVLAPIVIDLSVFGAARSLVRTAGIAARLKLGEAVPVKRPAAPAKPRPVAAIATPAADAMILRTAAAPAATSPPAPARESTPVQLSNSSAPKAAPRPAVESAPESAAGIEEQVARVIAARAVKQPAETIREILAAKARGMAKQPIADSLNVHHSVVGNVLRAAAEPAPPRTLTAV